MLCCKCGLSLDVCKCYPDPSELMGINAELLASLIEFVDCVDGEHTIEMYHRARNAIAKVEGRAGLFQAER